MTVDAIDPTLASAESAQEQSGRDTEVPPDEERVVKELLEWVRRCKQYKETDGKTYRDKIKDWRNYVAGRQNQDGKTGLATANIVQEIIKKSVNRAYARNPQISITPEDYVGNERIKLYREFGRTSEIVVNYFLRRARIKRKAKSVVRSSMTARIGWAKVILQTDKKKDPHIATRIHDSQDNLQRLRALREQIEAGEDFDKVQADILRHEQLIEALQAKAEVDVATGFAIQNVLPENIILDPLVLRNLDDYSHSPRIGELIPMTQEMAIDEFGLEVAESLQKFQTDTTKAEPNGGAEANKTKEDNGIFWIYEIWDRKQMMVYTVAEGGNRFLRKPWPPKNVGEQWYPYFPLGLNMIDGELYPLSNVELIAPLQDALNTALTNFQDHREKSIPFSIFNKGNLSEADLKKLSKPKPFENMGLDGAQGTPAKDLFHVVEHPRIDPAVYSTEHFERMMERLTGGGDITQPKNNKSGTLGEAQLLSGDIQNDTGADQDEIEDWYHRLATYIWQVCLLVIPKEKVQEIAGEGAVWPELPQTRDQIYKQMRLVVQAGSSGKPDKIREQLALSKTMPALQEMILKIAELREGGNEELAEVMKKIAQEFMRRADEKIDVEEFFPEKKEGEEEEKAREQEQAKAQQLEQIEQQQQLMKAQLEKLLAEIEKTRSETDKNLVEAEVKSEEIKTKQADTAIKLASTVKDLTQPSQVAVN